MSAVFSECFTYRYVLHREIPSALRWVKPCLWIMLNPSTAGASVDDPTIRRCIGFSKAWGCTKMTVVNLFALRATDPAELAKHHDPVGPDNLTSIVRAYEEHKDIGLVVAAWGAHPMAHRRARDVYPFIMGGLKSLGVTKDGWPKHPLYVPGHATLSDWSYPV